MNVQYRKIVCVVAILLVFSIFSSSVLALEPSEKEVYDSHENTEMIWYDEYGNVIDIGFSWDNTNDHPTMDYYEFVGYDPYRYYEGVLDKYDWSYDGSWVYYHEYDILRYEERYYTGYYYGIAYLYIII